MANQRIEDGSLVPSKLLTHSLRQLDSLVNEGRTLLVEAAIKVGNFGRVLGVTRFQHVLHIEVGAPAATHQSLMAKAGKIIRLNIDKLRRDGTSAIEQIPVQGNKDCSVPHGFWLCARGPASRGWLIRLAREVMSQVGRNLPVRAVLFADLPRGLQLVRGETENQYLNPIFWDRASIAIDRHMGHAQTTELHLLTDPEYLDATRNEIAEIQTRVSKDDPDAGVLRLTKTSKSTRMVTDTKTGEGVSQLAFPMVYPSKPIGNTVLTETLSKAKESRWHYDVGIVTIIPPETRAVLNFLSPNDNLSPKRSPYSGRIYYSSDLQLKNGQSPLRVVLTQALAQGNRSVIPAFYDVVNDYRPRWVILLGIAGSIHKDANLTDVVVADQSVYYDKRAETELGSKHRGEGYSISATLRNVVNAVLTTGNELDAVPNSFSPKFTIHLGPLGTGEAVVKFRNAEVRQWLSAFNDKTLALETEAGGFEQAFYEMKLNPDSGPEGSLILRGISDHADHEKSDKWQEPAAQNCCRVMRQVFQTMIQLNLIG